MEYFIQDTKGQEQGPIDQGTLIDWAKKGQVTPQTNVRNTLMKNWKLAKDIVILTSIFKEQADLQSHKLGNRLKENATSHRENQEIKNLNLTKDSVKQPSIQFRLGSFILDLTILVAISYAALFIYLNFISTDLTTSPEALFQKLIGSASLAESEATLLFESAVAFIILMQLYWTFTIGLWAQTIGQKFFGIMQIKHNTLGAPVLLARAYFYSLFFVIFFPINFFFIFVFRRGLHETLSGSSVVNVSLG